MSEEHYEPIEEAAEAFRDSQAGVETPPKDDEPSKHFNNVEEALEDMQAKREADADVARHVQRTETAEKNEKSASESFELKGEDSEKISQYQKEYGSFASEYQTFVQAAASVDWDSLKNSNPGEYVYLKQQMDEAQSALEKKYNTLTEAGKGLQKSIASGVLERERSKMLEKAPELAEPAVLEELKDYMLSNGYTREEIEGAADHKLVLAAYKAMQADKQPKTKGRILYKGNRKSEDPGLPLNVVNAQQRFESTRSLGDLLALMDAQNTPDSVRPAKKAKNTKTQSRIAELQKIVNRNPNSRDAIDAGAEMFALKRAGNA